MEQLAESFTTAFSVSCEPNDTAAQHPRLSQFKAKPRNVPDQNVRRKRMLDEQKRKRCDYVNYSRRLVDGDLDENDLDLNNEEEEMEATYFEEKKARRRRRVNHYAYQLMLSEWLVDIPADLVDEWLMVVCPVGKRNLLIAANGNTSAYTKSGYLVNRFSSLLPCGSPGTCRPGEYTILDCIFDELSRTIYILDIMCWRGHPVYDSETEFRFYWMNAKLEEEPGLREISPANPYRFMAVSSYSCKTDVISSVMSAPSSFKVDGLLFYHKRTHYTRGRTPLVGWLKPYMLPDILGISVTPEIMAEAPLVNKLTLLEANKELRVNDEEKENAAQQNGADEMETESPSKQRRRRRNKKKCGNEMDVCEENKGGEHSSGNKNEDSEWLAHSEKMEVNRSSAKSQKRREKKNKKEVLMDTASYEEGEKKTT